MTGATLVTSPFSRDDLRARQAAPTMVARMLARLRATLRLSPIHDLTLPLRLLLERKTWHASGETGPAPRLIKHAMVRHIALQSKIRVFVETGTYLGTMVRAVMADFDSIYSIELNEQLANRAIRRFARYDHISILHGDSAEILSALVPHLRQPTLFWLDAHYSGGVTASRGPEGPILNELAAIAGSTISARHAILIDDARLFVGGDYPALKSLLTTVSSCLPRHRISVTNDMILVIPIDGANELPIRPKG